MKESAATAPLKTKPDDFAFVTVTPELKVMGISPAAHQILGVNPGQSVLQERLFDSTGMAQFQSAMDQVVSHDRFIEGLQVGLLPGCNRKERLGYALFPLRRNRQIIGAIMGFQRLSPPEHHWEVAATIDSRTLFETLPGGVMVVDANLRITEFNRSAEHITGFRRDEILGRFCWEVFGTPHCQNKCPIQLAFEQGSPQTDREASMACRPSGHRSILVRVAVLKDQSDRVTGAVLSFHPTGFDTTQPATRGVCQEKTSYASRAMRSLMALIPDLATSQANIIIRGESGTGKEVLARAIHLQSPQAGEPFMAVNCAALPETLLEAELFGYEKGAFTGAAKDHPGRFERVAGGTLFLDEIGELKPELQIKLLRVLEERQFERVGGIRPIPLRARIISATHQNLEDAIKRKRFRSDLYYRLRTVPLTIAPLRDRREDIPLLIDCFIAKYNSLTGKQVRAMDPKAMDGLCHYRWPGNVRELERAIEYAFVFVKGPVIFQRHLPAMIHQDQKISPRASRPVRRSNPPPREEIISALDRTGGRLSETARLLGIGRTSLWRYKKKYGLSDPLKDNPKQYQPSGIRRA